MDEFLDGILAILVIKGRPRIEPKAHVLDAAMAHVMESMQGVAGRHRVTFDFRLRAGTLNNPRSPLSKALKERVAAKRLEPTSDGGLRIAYSEADALETLRALPHPASFFESAGKRFMKVHEAARIREFVATGQWKARKTAPSEPAQRGK